MTACMIMHNMIIENGHGKNLDCTFYDLMGVCVMPLRKEERVGRFMKVFNEIRDSNTHDELQKDLMGCTRNGIAKESPSFIIYLFYCARNLLNFGCI